MVYVYVMQEKDSSAISDRDSSRGAAEYIAPNGVNTELHFNHGNDHRSDFDVFAEWIVLRKNEKPSAEVFHVAYLGRDEDPASRPISFVFNGGPGAASAYLHVGAVGPKRVRMNDDGAVPAPPVELVENAESWLPFTDLVFVDPVGTGFSRIIEKQDSNVKKGEEKASDAEKNEYYDLERDLQSLGEFMQRFLSIHNRWRSPIFIAGESYGGFRVARLTRLLQQGYGIGLRGAILISPALEFSLLSGSDYDVLPWIDVFPSMVAAAVLHDRSKDFAADTATRSVAETAATFATEELAPLLVGGARIDESRTHRTLSRVARMLGLDERAVLENRGRIRPSYFARNLLRDRKLVCGMYDASITAVDPYPDRDVYEGPDPTLWGIERLFMAGINEYLRTGLELQTEREYHLLGLDVNKAWTVGDATGKLASHVGSVDELRYGMSINPYMKVLISHGYYDLVTPFHSSDRIASLMKLDDSLKPNLSLHHFAGGHMFYTWDSSRAAFRDLVRNFYVGKQP